MYNINIDSNLIDTLVTSSTNDSVTPELWIERKINAILLSQLKNDLANKIQTAKPADVPTFAEVINQVVADIEVRDYVEPTVVTSLTDSTSVVI